MKNFWMIILICIASGILSCSKNDDKEIVFYTVIFETDGGSPVPATQRVEAGDLATTPTANPVKTGYVFLFWHLDARNTAYNFQTPVTEDITLYAKWQEEAITEYWQVSWELNDGTWPSDDNHATQVVKGGTLAEPNAPQKAGKTFDGWYQEEALTNKTNFPYNVINVTANIKLYAKWVEPATEYWQITWELDGGAWPSTDDNHITEIEKGSKLNEPNAPVKSGHTFDGWYTEVTFANKVTFPYTIANDLKLYAKWTAGDVSNRGQGLYIGNSILPVDLKKYNGSFLTKAAQYIDDSPYADYTLILEEDAVIEGQYDLTKYGGGTTTIIGRGGVRNISRDGDFNAVLQSYFGSTLIIGENINITGEMRGLYVIGTTIMKAGSSIKVRINSVTNSEAVHVAVDESLFIMEGGIISGNVGTGSSGGVHVSWGEFVMEGGVIEGNVASEMGGGVSIYKGKFTMKGGTIRNNYAGLGGGVCVWGSGSFIMEGGTISENSAHNGIALGVPVSGGGLGGGVYVGNNPGAADKGEFIMKGGTIYGTTDVLLTNFAQKGGASLYIDNGATAKYGTGTSILLGTSASTNNTLTGK